MEYLKHLSKDKKLAKILGDHSFTLVAKKNTALQLMGSVISQQLSTKVAKVIYDRFLGLYGGKPPALTAVLATPDESLRAIGLSRSKLGYIKNVAAFCLEQKITDRYLAMKSDQEIIELLVQIKGIGKWSVEMLLMFSLARPDVFPVDDLGIQQAMIKVYRLDNLDKPALKAKMIEIAEKWAPFRTFASLHLWKHKDA